MRIRLIASLMCLLLAVACSSEPQTSASPRENGETPGLEDTTLDRGPAGGGKEKLGKGSEKKSGDAVPSSDKNKDAGGSASKRHGGDEEPSSDSGDSGGSGGDLAYPAAGKYTYDQSGFEEFCQTTCEREDLPAQQPVKVSYKKSSDTQAVVVSEVRASAKRIARTTFKFTPKKALITEVFTHFEYEGFEFSDSYHPQPPVEALRFPLEAGTKWSGSWKDKTSGDYSISVGETETISVNGRSVKAFRIETDTTFKGQFDGRSVVTVWFDPETKTPIKSDGSLNVKSAFGRYNTEFQTVLVSGPGY